MIRINSPFGKTVSVTCTFALVFCMVPSMAWATTVKQASNWVKETKNKLNPVKELPTNSKILSAAMMRQMQGKGGENPYAAGQRKTDVMYRNVNLMSGNYSLSNTDLTFEGGYGIPVNVTRSYSSNDGEEGPFGKGWTLSADVRSTAGGVAKGKSAPVRSVPTNFKERPTTQLNDPNVVQAEGSNTQPIQAVLATNADGQEETIQRDADGILSTPPWDKNKVDSIYDTVIGSDGTNYQVMIHNVVNTPEGTVYVYDKQGYYGTTTSVYGLKPYNDSGATAEPSNVMKITTATDRNGNVTTYTYGSGTVSFTKRNGNTIEHPLTKVHMPNGHEINFVWGTGTTANRVVEVNDGSGIDYRHAYYTYTDGLLTAFTTPGGKTTTYGYGNASIPSGETYTDPLTNVMSSITDCRGLTTSIYYTMQWHPRMGAIGAVSKIIAPNGADTRFYYYTGDSGYHGAGFTWAPGATVWIDQPIDASGIIMNVGTTVTVDTYRPYDTPYDYATNYKYSSTVYDTATQNENSVTTHLDLAGSGYAVTSPKYTNTTSTTYNFMGNPLVKTMTEYDTAAAANTRTATVAYAYWGAEKYYQQKATKDPAGRYSFIEYYDSSATTGKKGQQYRLYEAARGAITLDSTTIPVYSVPNTDSYWRYRVCVTGNEGKYSAQFDYDSKGRTKDVWKLQSTTTTPWTWVQTHSTFGSDGSPSWGAGSEVVEDYGGIGRTTDTLEFDTFGRAVKIQDASGKVFHTTYDKDGVISSIERLTGSTSTPIVSFSYGALGVINGQLTSVVDELSGVSQSMTYTSSGAGIGNPASVTETNGSDSYSTSYTYNSAGDRDTVTYVTQSALGLSNTVKWKYWDYVSLGMPSKKARVFQKMTNIDASTGSMTSEEFQYSYDVNGRPVNATFAMTPQSWTPSGGASYYDSSSHKAATRGRTFYDYDAGGRIKGIYNWWDTLSGGSYTSAPIRANECTFELSGSCRGLKTQSKYYNVSSGSWNLQRTESYGYEANLDYLTSANYGDGLSSATPTWTYDAVGNRASDSTNTGTWTYDNLNRMTVSPTTTYTNDILGNRTTMGSGGSATSYTWDDLNRMTGHSSSGLISEYSYRADGLRVSKSSHTGSSATTTTTYRYDGQMGIEDVETTSAGGGSVTAVSRNAVGARGIDAISRTTSSGTTVAYPLYDAHGNNVGLLSKSGSSWSIGDERSYDAWGNIRSGGTSDQKGRYCANLGHKQDDESGLIYMRARYYEPGSGRFVNEDPDREGLDYFTYCTNDPLNNVDSTGKSIESENIATGADILKLAGLLLMAGAIADSDLKGFLSAVSAAVKQCWTMARLSAAMVSKGPLAVFWYFDKYFGKAASVGRLAQRTKGIQRLGEVVMGYLMIITGYLWDIDAECIDPYAPNKGLSELY